jgi:hypothetical protein
MAKKTFRKIKNFVKSTDMFNHNVRLNFNKNGETFTTLLGGLASVGIILMLLILGISKGKDLIKK